MKLNNCWFCNNPINNIEEELILYSKEFDCYLHMDCLLDRVLNGDDNPEVEIIANEYGLINKLLDNIL